MSPEFETDRSDFLGCSEVWYEAAENDVRSHVGCQGITGLGMLMGEFVNPGPFETSHFSPW
jgi:hypothetical protein